MRFSKAQGRTMASAGRRPAGRNWLESSSAGVLVTSPADKKCPKLLSKGRPSHPEKRRGRFHQQLPYRRLQGRWTRLSSEAHSERTSCSQKHFKWM